MFHPSTPGLFEQPPRPSPAAAAVRDDIAAFVGLTTRGPVDRGILVESWEEFRTHFGDRSDSFFLPDAVLAFFLNGGKSCYVVRVLHRDPVGSESFVDVGRAAQADCRALTIGTPLGPFPTWLAAQNGVPDPGSWGNDVAVAIRFVLRLLTPLPTVLSPAQLRFDASGKSGRSPVGRGDLLWVVGSSPLVLAAVVSVTPAAPLTMGSQWGATPTVDAQLAGPLPFGPADRLAVVEATVDVLTADGQREHFERLGLDSRHPRYLPAVLGDESLLVALQDGGAPDHDTTLLPVQLAIGTGTPSPPDELAVTALGRDADPVKDKQYRGRDGIEQIQREDFFDAAPDSEQPWRNRGLQQLDAFADVSLVVMPDLVMPAELPPTDIGLDRGPVLHQKRTRFVCAPAEPELLLLRIVVAGPLGTMKFTWQLPGGSVSAPVATAAGARFLFAVPGQPFWVVTFPDGLYVVPDSYNFSSSLAVTHLGTGAPMPSLSTAAPAEPPSRPYNLLDPKLTGMWQDLADAETRLVAYCTGAGDRVCLLAPPPSAGVDEAIAWRARFDSAFAAAYYPWLEFGDPVVHPPVRLTPPTGVAAGIIARSTLRSGVGRAPANLPALSTSGLATAVSADDWAFLHEVNFDVFRQLPDEVRLLGARTLSSDVSFRYLHARRLLTHVRRQVERRMTWVVFEPSTPTLWKRVVHDVDINILRPLYDRAAFAGATRADSYFVRCDAALNPPEQIAVGELVCEIGIAPNTPAEYLVFRLAASRDNGVVVEEVD